MITLCDGAVKSPLMGCRINTLYSCYRGPNAAVWLYKSDRGGAVCRFGASLLCCGEVDAAELFEFADMLGCSRIEYFGQDCFLPPKRWSRRVYPALYRDIPPSGEKIEQAVDMRRCFEILSQSDDEFSRGCEYLYWLSDMRSRQAHGCARAYLAQNAATAMITAADEASAYLSSVATLPQARGRGLASELLKKITSDSFIARKRLYTAAQSKELVRFYEKNGFAPLAQSLITFTKEQFFNG